MGEKEFKNDLDYLVNLLNKLKERILDKEIEGIDESFFEDFDTIINNYKQVKEEVSETLLNQFGEPIHALVTMLIDKLKDELEENEDEELNILNRIQEIDNKLCDASLSSKEIDTLLDKRSAFKAK